MADTNWKRILAIGDIHGCSTALDQLLAVVAPRTDDLLIMLGDYVDRGPDSSGVLSRLLKLKQKYQLITLRGNHEVMMLAAREDNEQESEWLECGGREALRSYSILDDDGKLVDVPEEHWQFLEQQCIPWYETETHFFVHANVYPDLPLDEQPDYMLYWEPFDCPRRHMSGKVMVCGHTPQKNGWPKNLGHVVCLDTWVYGRGWLSCIDVITGKLWQANQDGETRIGWLDELLSEPQERR